MSQKTTQHEQLKEEQKIEERGAYFKIKKPKWSFADIGGLRKAKEMLLEMAVLPVKYREPFDRLKFSVPSGILLWGPPGGGKTVLAEACAYEANCNYISTKAIEILSEPEEIFTMYETAQELAPCIIFINEVDALAPVRGATSQWVYGITRDAPVRIAPEKTTEIFYRALDNANKSSKDKQVITIGGTYRPDILDKQSLKKGRLERKVYVSAPDLNDRIEIFNLHLKGAKLDKGVSVKELGKRTEYYVGADIVGVIREAKLIAIKEGKGNFAKLKKEHFEKAMKRVPPSLSSGAVEKYEETLKYECEHCYLF